MPCPWLEVEDSARHADDAIHGIAARSPAGKVRHLNNGCAWLPASIRVDPHALQGEAARLQPDVSTLVGLVPAEPADTLPLSGKVIRAAFRWGFKKDLVDRDVSAKLDRPAEEHRLPTEERTLNDEEVRRLWLGVEPLGREISTFILLPLLSGTGRGETALAEWREFDLREQGTSVWRIRAEHRKGQRGKKRGLVIPLPPLAVRLLLALREETGGGTRVFPAVGERFLINLYRSTEEVRKATGVRFSLHDPRATCATGVRRMSGLPHVPALVPGHQGVPGVPDVTSSYDRADTVPEVAKGLNAWAAHIESLVRQEPPLRVVSIQSTRKRMRR